MKCCGAGPVVVTGRVLEGVNGCSFLVADLYLPVLRTRAPWG